MARTRTVGEDILMQQIPLAKPLTDQQRAVATRVVCGNAVDAGEARELLAMLGLI